MAVTLALSGTAVNAAMTNGSNVILPYATFTATLTNGAATITSPSSTSNWAIGAIITGTGIPANTTLLYNGTSWSLSNAFTGTTGTVSINVVTTNSMNAPSTAGLTNGSTAIGTFSGTAVQGGLITGTGIPNGTYLVYNGTTWTLSQAYTGTTGTVQVTVESLSTSNSLTISKGIQLYGWQVGALVAATGLAANTNVNSVVCGQSVTLSNTFTGTTGAVSVVCSSFASSVCTITLAASGDTATPGNFISNGYGLSGGNKVLNIVGALRIKLQIATGAVFDDTEWTYNFGAGGGIQMNETYGCGIWRSGYVLNGSTYVPAKGHTINYNNFVGSSGTGGASIFYNSGTPAGYVAGTTMPTVQWNDVSWVEQNGSNGAAIPTMYYGSWGNSTVYCGRVVFDYNVDSAGANSGFGGSYGYINELLLAKCIGSVSTGADSTKVVSVGTFYYFSLPSTGTEVRMAFPNNVTFSGYAPITYQVPATNTYVCQNTSNNEFLLDPVFPTGFNFLTNCKNYSNGTRTYLRTVSFNIYDSTSTPLTGTTLYINSGSNTLINSVQAGATFSQGIQSVYLSWIGRVAGGYITPISYTDTRVQTALFRKTGYAQQSINYSLQDNGVKQPVYLVADTAMGAVTASQAAALTGIALDFTNSIVTVSASHTLDEVYAFGSYSLALPANTAQSVYQTNTSGTYALTAPWTMKVTSGTLTMGTANKTFNGSTQWLFTGATAALTLNKVDIVWTPATYAAQISFAAGATFNISNGATLTVNPSAALGYGSPEMFGSNTTLNMSNSTFTYNVVDGGSGTFFSASTGDATWNISNSTWTLNKGGASAVQIAIHAYITSTSVINGWTINGTGASSTVMQVGYLTNNQKMTNVTFPGALFGNGTSNVLMDTYTYSGANATIPNTFGSNNKWYFVDPKMSAGGAFTWLAGSTPTGVSGYYGVVAFRPTITIDKNNYAPKVRFKPSAMSSRYPSVIASTTAYSTVALSNLFRDPTFMSASDGFLPFIDSLDDKTILNTIDWTITARSPGWLDQSVTFTSALALYNGIKTTFSGAVDVNYVNYSTAVADSSLITVNTSTKTLSATTGTLNWSPQRLYNALKNWWATFASDTDFLSATGLGVLDLGNYNIDSSIVFIKGASNDALTLVNTTGTVASIPVGVIVTDSRGSTFQITFTNL